MLLAVQGADVVRKRAFIKVIDFLSCVICGKLLCSCVKDKFRLDKGLRNGDRIHTLVTK
jgi:hypothetical protein